MEPVYFILGAVIIISIIDILGAAFLYKKINSLEDQVDSLENEIVNIYHNLDSKDVDLTNRISQIYDHISHTNDNLHNRMDEIKREFNHKFENKKVIKG